MPLCGQGTHYGEAMKVTAIIPTYNRAALVGETVSAVLAQNRQPDEVIVVNDGSDDATSEVLNSFGNRIRVLDKPNSGKADSLNAALGISSGSHVWIVDDDDLPRPDGLRTLCDLLERHPDAELAYGRHERFEIDPVTGIRSTKDTGYWDARPSEWFLIATLEDFFAHQPAMLVSRVLYDRAGPFNPGMHASEDYEMLVRLASAGIAVGTEAVIFDQRVHSGVRGQRGFRYAAAARDQKWIHYDQIFLTRVLEDFPLSAFLPRGTELTPRTERQALLQRGTIWMRHGLREQALEDFRQASGIHRDVDLTPAERSIVMRAMTGKYGCEDLPGDEASLRALRTLSREGKLAREIVNACARPLVWQTRAAFQEGRIGLAARFLRSYFRLRFLTVQA